MDDRQEYLQLVFFIKISNIFVTGVNIFSKYVEIFPGIVRQKLENFGKVSGFARHNKKAFPQNNNENGSLSTITLNTVANLL